MGAGDRAPGRASQDLCLLIQKLRPPHGGVRALEDLGQCSRTRPWPKHSQWAKIVNGERQITFEVLDELMRLHYEAGKPPRPVPQAERKRAVELWKAASGDFEQTSVEVQLLDLERRLRQTTETQLAMQVIINAQSKAIDGLSVLTMKLLEERNHVTSDARRTQNQLDRAAAAAHRRQLAGLLQTLENSIAGIDLRLIRAEHQRARATQYRSEAEQLRSQAIHDAARLREALEALGELASPAPMDTMDPSTELDVSRSTLSMDSVDDVLAGVDEQQDAAAAMLEAAERQLHPDKDDERDGTGIVEGEVISSDLHDPSAPDRLEVIPPTAPSLDKVDVLYVTPSWYGSRDHDPSLDGRSLNEQPASTAAATPQPRNDLSHLAPAPEHEQTTIEEVPTGEADTTAKVRRLPASGYPTRGRLYPHARRHGQAAHSQSPGQDEVDRETPTDTSTPTPADHAAPEGHSIPPVSQAPVTVAASDMTSLGDMTSLAQPGSEAQATASTARPAVAATPADNPEAEATTARASTPRSKRLRNRAKGAWLLTRVATDQLLNPDHEQALIRRHQHAHHVGESGNVTEAVRLFAALAEDTARVLGPERALNSRHHHAFYLGESGNRAKAARLFAALAEDTAQMLGPDHPFHLLGRYEHALNLGEAGQPGEAARLLAVLVKDTNRMLGPYHLQTLKSEEQHSRFFKAQQRTLEP